MEKVIFGNFISEGLEVVERGRRFYVRYDAGSHLPCLHEDEISEEEYKELIKGPKQEYSVIVNMQNRLESLGINPYVQNWTPKQGT